MKRNRTPISPATNPVQTAVYCPQKLIAQAQAAIGEHHQQIVTLRKQRNTNPV